MIVVCETNIFISALRFGGNPDEIIGFAREAEIGLATSPFILDEFKRILRINSEQKNC